MLPHQTVRVFVSSTFRDMHAERDHLVKHVVPALRERLDPYRVDLVDVDLRWGITEAQAADGRVLSLCLAEIEACRPYFVGLLGQRYGWVPDRIPPDDLARHRWMKDEADTSITELEILYGALGSEAKEARSFFYFRDSDALANVPADRLPTYVDDDPVLAERLDGLKARIRAETDQWAEYPARWDADAYDWTTRSRGRLGDLDAFGERVLEDLWTAIRKDLDLPETPPRDTYASPLDRERDVQERFMDYRLTGVSREVRADTQAALLGYALGAAPPGEPVRPLLLAGPAGSGKSTALALLVRTLTPAPNDASKEVPQGGWPLVVARFAGASAASTSLREVLTQALDVLDLAYEARPDRGRSDLPDLVRALREAFEAVPDGERVVLVVDALNQFDEGETAERLGWLPAVLPPTVRVVLSAIDRDADGVPTTALRAAEARARVLPLGPLTDDERRTVAREVPAIAAKTLDDRLLDRLLANPATRNPLFLRVALEELRGSALHETLGEQIDGLPVPDAGEEAAPLEELFGQVLERVEQDFDAALVSEALGLLAAARRGLTEPELRDLTAGLRDAGDLFPVLRQLRPYLMRRGAVTDFFHRSLWKAARARYAPDEAARRADHERLADYFSAQPDYLYGDAREAPNTRRADELFTHLMEAERWDNLTALCQTFDYLQARTDLGDPARLAADLARAAGTLPHRIPERGVLRIVGRAIGHDVGFLRRHPGSLFQQLWNRAWWWDAPACADHLDPEIEGRAPWLRKCPMVYEVVERWRSEGAARSPWLRPLRPPGDLHTTPHLVLRGHEISVHTVLWSPDGARIATVSGDHSVRLWDAVTGAEVAVLKGHDGPANGVAWSPDGARLATASSDHSVRVWEAATGAEVAELRGHEQEVHFVAWSPDSARLATASRHFMRAWNATTGSEIAALEMSVSSTKAVAWSPDGTRLATASGHSVRVWEAATGAEVTALRGHEQMVSAVAWSPDSTRLATASEDGTARVWDAATGSEVATLTATELMVSSIAWAPSGARIVTGGYGETARVWEVSASAELARLKGHEDEVYQMEWSPNGSLLATAAHDQSVRVWCAVTGAEVTILKGYNGAAKAVAWSPDGMRLATASFGDYGVAAQVCNAVTGAHLVELTGHEQGISAVAWSPDGARLATASQDRTARVLDANTGVEIAVLRGHWGWVNAVAWSPDGTRLATASHDGTAMVWEAGSGAEIFVLGGHEGWVTTVKWSLDGARLATASSDGPVRVWEAATGEEIHLPDAVALAGEILAADKRGSELRLSGAASGNETRVLRASDGEPLAYLPALLSLLPSPGPEPLFAAQRGSNVYLYRLEESQSCPHASCPLASPLPPSSLPQPAASLR